MSFPSCHPGWSGPDCDVCIKLPGCTEHGHCSKPMECICDYGFEGHFCHKAKCRDNCNTTTGFCDHPHECWCHIGWTGPTCEECMPYPGCKNGRCDHPWECICEGGFSGKLCDQYGTTTTKPYHPNHQHYLTTHPPHVTYPPHTTKPPTYPPTYPPTHPPTYPPTDPPTYPTYPTNPGALGARPSRPSDIDIGSAYGLSPNQG